MKRFILAFAVAIVASLFAPQLSHNVAQAQEKPIWIDVRTQAEFDNGHLQSAVLIPYEKIAQKIASVVPDKRRRINLYCRSGRRAEIALHTLEKLGYISVQNLGALSKLRKQGFK